jgi:hypothetical protein
VTDAHFSDVERIVLVEDNLNTHCPASLYGTFPAAEVRRLVERLEWHYTPIHLGDVVEEADGDLMGDGGSTSLRGSVSAHPQREAIGF